MSNNKKQCLTKADLADSVYTAIPVDKQQAQDIVESFIEIIKEGLDKDGKVMWSGLGCWEVKAKPPRRGRNPQTGESITLRGRKVIKFKTSQILRRAINNGKLHAKEGEDEGTDGF